MKLFFASDLHGCLASTQTMLNAFEQSGAEHLILLGDLLNHGPRNAVPAHYAPAQVAELLNTYADRIIALRGNCDSEVDQMLLHFPMMGDHHWVLLPEGRRLFLTHGHLYHADKRPPMRAGDALVHGHTHIPVAQYQGEQFIFNPGSTTIPKGGYAPSYGLYQDGQFTVMSFAGDTIVSGAL
ncbi:Phosphodiesterase YfcE [Vibrio stylophorae]|uniref:Phosphoesterase n=1 Tax=Vibrio stylophorae TaxID=659351 RepID=A0ABN8DSC2_9VIBR|nr:phosphodiesterase [Vibrio stylophorae]CAH0534001.1 Phosphodiesterase YfcE [Vibrio stylophorae]